jgi:hypothetical protein
MSLGLPFPVLHGLNDAERNFDAIRTQWSSVEATVVTGLPSNPFDGQMIDYVADPTNGVVWRFRYRAASASVYKWEFAGGSSLVGEALADSGRTLTSASTWSGIDANDPRVTVPLAGDYEAETVTSMSCDRAGTLAIGIKVGATEPILGTNAAYAYLDLGTGSAVISQDRKLLAVAASTVLQQRYWQNAGSANLGRRSSSLKIRPVRVG